MNSNIFFSEIGDAASPLEELSKKFDTIPQRDLNKSLDVSFNRSLECILPNKEEGLRREAEVKKELEEKYPESEGYEIISEAYLRDSEGNIVRDPETNTARRIDFVVVKDGVVVDSIEVTSETADKTGQSDKEARIRAEGGNYVRTGDGTLARFPDDVETKIERRK